MIISAKESLPLFDFMTNDWTIDTLQPGNYVFEETDYFEPSLNRNIKALVLKGTKKGRSWPVFQSFIYRKTIEIIKDNNELVDIGEDNNV